MSGRTLWVFVYITEFRENRVVFHIWSPLVIHMLRFVCVCRRGGNHFYSQVGVPDSRERQSWIWNIFLGLNSLLTMHPMGLMDIILYKPTFVTGTILLVIQNADTGPKHHPSLSCHLSPSPASPNEICEDLTPPAFCTYIQLHPSSFFGISRLLFSPLGTIS
jgi:hypothetical protein